MRPRCCTPRPSTRSRASSPIRCRPSWPITAAGRHGDRASPTGTDCRHSPQAETRSPSRSARDACLRSTSSSQSWWQPAGRCFRRTGRRHSRPRRPQRASSARSSRARLSRKPRQSAPRHAIARLQRSRPRAQLSPESEPGSSARRLATLTASRGRSPTADCSARPHALRRCDKRTSRLGHPLARSSNSPKGPVRSRGRLRALRASSRTTGSRRQQAQTPSPRRVAAS